VASLWRVPEGQRQELLGEFLRRAAAGEACPDALRAAQAKVRAAHPGTPHWAAFVCYGGVRAAP
jgi:CHAT domain-containing protein